LELGAILQTIENFFPRILEAPEKEYVAYIRIKRVIATGPYKTVGSFTFSAFNASKPSDNYVYQVSL
jgi:hypothetical protein